MEMSLTGPSQRTIRRRAQKTVARLNNTDDQIMSVQPPLGATIGTVLQSTHALPPYHDAANYDLAVDAISSSSSDSDAPLEQMEPYFSSSDEDNDYVHGTDITMHYC